MVNQDIAIPHKFSSQLFKTVANQSKGSNHVFSPISIYMALLMATSGAKDETFVELSNSLGIDNFKTIDEFRHAVEGLASKFFSNLNPKLLKVANNAFVSNIYPLDEKYAEHAKKAFNIDATEVDFASHPEDARKQINEWISKNTNNKITELIAPGSITDQTKLVLANAVHFLASWKDAFEKKYTKSATFYGVDGESKVQMMNKKDTDEEYGEEGGFHWVSLGFSDTKYKLTIITSKKTNSDEGAFNEWVSNKLAQGVNSFKGRKTELSLSIPKFEIEHSLDLESILQQAPFNIKKAFSHREADFTNLTANPELFLDHIFHKAIIKIDENGAEAVAATALSFSDSLPLEFNANRPFAFVLSENATQSALFVGKINKL